MKAIGIILAGGNNRMMRELSNKRAIAAMPIAGSYRAIDFALSNMTNSRIQKVAVITQYNARSLNEHLSSSKWWDFGRKQGGLFVFTPTITAERKAAIFVTSFLLGITIFPFFICFKRQTMDIICLLKLNCNDILCHYPLTCI